MNTAVHALQVVRLGKQHAVEIHLVSGGSLHADRLADFVKDGLTHFSRWTLPSAATGRVSRLLGPLVNTVRGALESGRRSVQLNELNACEKLTSARDMDGTLARFAADELGECVVFRDADGTLPVADMETDLNDALARLDVLLARLDITSVSADIDTQAPEQRSVLAGARARREALIAAEAWLSSDEVGRQLGGNNASAAAIKQRPTDARRRGKIFGVWHDGKFYHPVFQFNQATGTPVAQMGAILRALPKDRTGWTQALWFFRSRADLDGRRPADLMPSEIDRVLAMARAEGKTEAIAR
ncbi:hypothetical protein [Tahibacter amnicola]|uniref:Antitoxin Xre/MbcA/ParS-like toxin-binding domain-containing protein n=1 Tax=Tahibacter amnicola TaxID=2976241 RepID=A0ABY6BEX2_9GAMM|nr:hypothetical protein [Tahibacter amnicola]UXI68355.1 hypothetical protein N4264_01505 [Tahibacter amnicola]